MVETVQQTKCQKGRGERYGIQQASSSTHPVGALLTLPRHRFFLRLLTRFATEPELPRGIFGVPLITSIPYANVAISLFNESGESYIYGYVPIVVAKCGVFLKEKGWC